MRDKASKESFAPEADIGLFVERRCQEHGVILRFLGDTLTAAPPLTADRETLEEIVRVVGDALDEMLAHARSQGWV